MFVLFRALDALFQQLESTFACDKDIKVYSEFSGYRTAEIACECAVEHSKTNGHVMNLSASSADISKNCQKVIGENLQVPKECCCKCASCVQSDAHVQMLRMLC